MKVKDLITKVELQDEKINLLEVRLGASNELRKGLEERIQELEKLHAFISKASKEYEYDEKYAPGKGVVHKHTL